MNTTLENDELNLLSLGTSPVKTRNRDTEKLRKRAEEDAAEIIKKSGVREAFRESFKSICHQKSN